MNSDSLTKALTRIKVDEGYREFMYKCSRGYNTIGYGTNLDDGLDREEAEAVLLVRLKRSARRLIAFGLGDIHPDAFAVCLNMCYQMGDTGFLKFRNTINFLLRHEYSKASYEMLDSAWALQTPHRAKRLSLLLRALGDADGAKT